MSETVKIKIAKIGRKEMPSKFKEGETYSITTILDEISGRKGAAMGKFADGWKIGDTVEGIWEKRTWKDKDGFAQESWNIKSLITKQIIFFLNFFFFRLFFQFFRHLFSLLYSPILLNQLIIKTCGNNGYFNLIIKTP